MWVIVDHRRETSKLHFAESEAKRDVRRICRRNQGIEVEEHEKQTTKTVWSDAFEYHKGTQGTPWFIPPRTLFEGEDFDLPFNERQWTDLFDDENDLMQGPAMTEDEYNLGQEPEDDAVGLSAFTDDDEDIEADAGIL